VESGNDLGFETSSAGEWSSPAKRSRVYSVCSEGPRVGIVDLRSAGFPYTMQQGSTADCGSVAIDTLVDRSSPRLYIDSDRLSG